MKVSIGERTGLVAFMKDIAKDNKDVKVVAKLALYTSILESRPTISKLYIAHQGLKDFINEVRSNEKNNSH